jgi:FAD/FMN-containing dehydrogenase
VSVRGGGHGIAGHSLVDDGVVLDLSGMRGTVVDPTTRTVSAQGGALNAHVDREGQAFGLAMTSGYISHTGIAGLTLGGGIGHLMRKMGLAIDALRSCQVVTADGSIVRASEAENPDLFWGLRGGGGNFGVVTDFTFELQPLGPTILAGLVAWPADEAPTVLAFLRDFMADAPDEVGLMANLRLAPALPLFPEHLHGKPIIGLVATYAGPVEEGERVLAPVRSLGHPVLDTVAPKPYVTHQKFLDPAVPHGRHYYWKSHRVPELSDAVIDIIVERIAGITSPFSQIGGWAMGGAVSRVDPAATAVGRREVGFELNIAAGWLPSDPNPARHLAWVREGWEALRPYSVGVYANFLSDEGDAGVVAAYGQRLRRLTALKDRYDPTNVFRLNASIRPSRRS